MLEKLFKLKENNTTVKTEVLAGITTFMTMAYILQSTQAFWRRPGWIKVQCLLQLALAACLGTMLMAIFCKLSICAGSGNGG